MKRIVLIALAVATFLVPVPHTSVERYFADGAYPALQHAITPVTNSTSIAWFDVLLAAAAVLVVILLLRRGRILNLLALASVAWLLFLATWGLNYRRVPLEQKLAYDEGRVTSDNIAVIGGFAVREMNRLYAAAHAAPSPTLDELATNLAPAMERAARDLGVEPPVPARPKHTRLAPYFRRAGIDGMTDPFFLETLLASNLLEIEQPAALAHEWGHLAGLADESEASFLGWLTCLRGDSRAQYSGWVALYPHLLGALPESARNAVRARLAAGPVDDLRRIAERLAQSDESVRRVANTTYDRFLKANRVEEGIASYDAVVRLVVGATFGQRFTPRPK